MNNECRKCSYYHGRFYNDVWFNCAPHPNGIEQNCPDLKKKDEINPLDVIKNFARVSLLANNLANKETTFAIIKLNLYSFLNKL